MSESDVIRFCQFLAEIYLRKLETNVCTLPSTSRFYALISYRNSVCPSVCHDPVPIQAQLR